MNRTEHMANKLGMPQGTANNKLRKMILFDYVTRCGDNFCFKCGELITNIDELSIEHKEPWLYADNPVEAYFSLDNIAYSHLQCNRPHRYHGRLPKPAPEGTSWCTGCQDFLPIDSFWKLKSQWNGIHFNCIECQRKSKRRGVVTLGNLDR